MSAALQIYRSPQHIRRSPILIAVGVTSATADNARITQVTFGAAGNPFVRLRILLCALRPPGALLHVGLKGTERCLMAPDRKLQDLQQPFCGIQVGDNPLFYHDRLSRHADRLRIEPEIDEQLFRCARYATEIGVAGHRSGVIHFELRRNLLLRCLRFGSGLGHTR